MKKPCLMAKKGSLQFCLANIFPVHGFLRILTMLYRTKFRIQWYQLDKSINLFPVDLFTHRYIQKYNDNQPIHRIPLHPIKSSRTNYKNKTLTPNFLIKLYQGLPDVPTTTNCLIHLNYNHFSPI